MPHRAEQIMAAVETILTGLTTTGTNVERSRIYEIPAGIDAALSIQMGADEINDDGNMAFIDRLLNIEVIAHVKATSAIDTTLNLIRREVHVAMYADRRLGLGESIVIDTVVNDDGAPELSDRLEKPVALQTLNYIVRYRHSVADPGA